MSTDTLKNTLRDALRRRVRAVNQMLILHLIADKPHAIQALAEETGDSRQATDVAVNQMIKRGWVTVSDHTLPGEKRTIRVVSITEAGRTAAR